MTRPVHVVAVSARTPLGLTAEASAAAVSARISRLAKHPFIVDGAGDPLRCGRDGRLDPLQLGAVRITALARAALDDVLASLGMRGLLPHPLQVALALPEERPGFRARDADLVVRLLHDALPDVSVRALGSGHAGALHALAVASRAVADATTELCIVGGADSYLEADTLDWLDAELRLAREGVRGGFPPGEAASFVALASDEARGCLGLPSLCQVVGSSVSYEARRWDGDEGLLGEGLTRALLDASAMLRLPEERIDDVYCDINGERLRTDEWGLAIMRTQHIFRDPTAYTTCVGEWGDVGAATGALGCALAAHGYQRARASGERALIWGASWGGLRAACVLRRAGV